MVELNDADRRNIAAMAVTATKCAVFATGDGRTVDQMRAWMD
jgi:hypothetical protein